VSTKILVLCRSAVGKRMASPGIRSYQMARVLAEKVPDASVTLAIPAPTDLATEDLPFRVAVYNRRSLPQLLRDQEVVIANRFPFYIIPFLHEKRLVLDLFTPVFTEWMEIAIWFWRGFSLSNFVTLNRRNLSVQLTLADLVLFATSRQRDLYFGMLSGIGRVTPELYDHDGRLGNLFALAPFGVRPGQPKATRRVLRGVWPGIQEEDTILLWNGTIIEWYDLESLVRAVYRLSRERSDIKLFFLGTEHPDSGDVPILHGLGAGATRRAISMCEEFGILDKFVFFNFDWVDYDDTADYLLEADIGVCTYFDNLETRYAFRSRVLDLLWAELPIICTRGDVLAELVEARPLGIAVPERDEDALVDAIRRLADDKAFAGQCSTNLKRVKEEYRWERTLEPLVEYCRRPPDVSHERVERALPLALGLTVLAESMAVHGLYFRFEKLRRLIRRKNRPVVQHGSQR
jgi:glycosyltransferase involved in cell wall biosynthesis